jgi:hypothetical protein
VCTLLVTPFKIIDQTLCIHSSKQDRHSTTFRLPGLLPPKNKNHNTGMDAASSSRVITFLPPPLNSISSKPSLNSSPTGSSPEPTLTRAESTYPSPVRSRNTPRATASETNTCEGDSIFGVEVQDIMSYRLTSPPTSDPILCELSDKDDIEMPFDQTKVQNRYPHLLHSLRQVYLSRGLEEWSLILF